MTFGHLNRRTHLYLAMLLLPWFFMYGLSSLPFNHRPLFQRLFGETQWQTRFDGPYDIEIPPDADLRQVGAQILRDNGIKGDFGVTKTEPDELGLYVLRFITPTQVTYFPAERRLQVADRVFNWNSFLMGLHARGGFARDSLLGDAWAVVVDLVCIGMLIWIASGLYMWWGLRQTRRWGWLALGSGVLSFVGLLWNL